MDKYQQAILEIESNASKTIASTEKALRDRGLAGVPHGIGWGLGSELDYMMRFQVKPAVLKEKLEDIKKLKLAQVTPNKTDDK